MKIIHDISKDEKLFLLIFMMTFVVFIFTTNAHRYAIDDDIAQQMTIHLVTQKPDPDFIAGKSQMQFNYAFLRPWLSGPPCQNGILCYGANIGHSITEVPFVFVNHYFKIFSDKPVVLTDKDFDDPVYVWWRNSLEPDFTFLQLFYGPTLSALSVGVFFLVCRTMDFDKKNSIILTMFYGFTTTIWAYSKTSLNGVPESLFILLGFLLFKRFQKNRSITNVLLCATSLGFAFLTRPDAGLFILIIFLFFLSEIRKQDKKIIKIISFVLPIALSYSVYQLIDFVRYGPVNWLTSNTLGSTANTVASNTFISSIPVKSFGLLLSPGVGLLIFAPILLTVFFSFPDFYKRHRRDCIFFLCVVGLYVLTFARLEYWHGLVAWGARYLLPIIPFLLLPLGASLEKRKNKTLKISLITLGGFGVFFNLVYMIQDVSWFVWGHVSGPGNWHGLFSIAKASDPLYISPATLWSFQYNQLTQSIITAFTHLQPDIFLLKILGPIFFGLSFIALMIPLVYLLIREVRIKSESNNLKTEHTTLIK